MDDRDEIERLCADLRLLRLQGTLVAADATLALLDLRRSLAERKTLRVAALRLIENAEDEASPENARDC